MTIHSHNNFEGHWIVDKVLLTGLSSLLNKRLRELNIATDDSCEESSLIQHSLSYMASIKQVQITLWQDEANTAGLIISENVIQLCEQRTNHVRTAQSRGKTTQPER